MMKCSEVLPQILSDNVNLRCSLKYDPTCETVSAESVYFINLSLDFLKDWSLLCRVHRPIYTQRHAHVHSYSTHTQVHMLWHSRFFVVVLVSFLDAFSLKQNEAKFWPTCRFSGSIYIREVSFLQTLCNCFSATCTFSRAWSRVEGTWHHFWLYVFLFGDNEFMKFML